MPAADLKRRLGLSAVIALVMGDMIGSGIFFTPGELAPAALHTWQVYFIWTLCGLIVLCGALTLGELTSLIPRAGSTYHIISEAFGPLSGFVKAWMEIWVSAPGSIAGVAIVFGEYASRLTGGTSGAPPIWGVVAVATFALINLSGVQWGGRSQVILTSIKVVGMLGLVAGSYLLATAAPSGPTPEPIGLGALLRFVGIGVAAVLFTYDGWVDVSHVAGEVDDPGRTLPRGLALGVLGVTALYLIVNHAFLRVVPLERMREVGATVASEVATAAFGPAGGELLSGLIMISIGGALGGLVMTAPRLVYATAARLEPDAPTRWARTALAPLARVSPRTSVPASAIVMSSVLAVLAIAFFQTFDRLVAFILVPLQLMNVVTVAAVFRLRRREPEPGAYQTPGYPFVPLVFIVTMSLLMANAAYYNPRETLYGVGLTLLGVPAYYAIARSR